MSSRKSFRARENAPGARQWVLQAIRPVRELGFDFVKRLLQQEKIEKTICGFERLRPKPRVRQRRSIRRHEGGGGMFAPAFERAGELAVLVGRRLERALERSSDGVVDRSDEASHFAGGRSLAPAILDPAARFPVEVDDGNISPGAQHL